jgi:hypothetical protein
MRSTLAALVAGVALCASPALAQQFDNYGDGPIAGFQLPPGGLAGSNPAAPGQDGAPPQGGLFPLTQPPTGQGDGATTILPGTSAPIASISQPTTAQANRVTLRALDRMLGQPTDVEMVVGDTVIYGRIAIRVLECRFPSDDPASDAYAHLEILDLPGNRLFDGWMISSSPALNALEHPRHDVWVLRCFAE